MNLFKIPDGTKTMANLLEKEMAPSFMVCTFLISVGSFYGFALILFSIIILIFTMLFVGYFRVNNEVVKCSRILLVIFTLLLFISLMADDHVFNESTLPQKIEGHMTEQAKNRHAPNRNHMRNNTNVTADNAHLHSHIPWNETNATIHSNFTEW